MLSFVVKEALGVREDKFILNYQIEPDADQIDDYHDDLDLIIRDRQMLVRKQLLFLCTRATLFCVYRPPNWSPCGHHGWLSCASISGALVVCCLDLRCPCDGEKTVGVLQPSSCCALVRGAQGFDRIAWALCKGGRGVDPDRRP